jgi:hypothetical protein
MIQVLAAVIAVLLVYGLWFLFCWLAVGPSPGYRETWLGKQFRKRWTL